MQKKKRTVNQRTSPFIHFVFIRFYFYYYETIQLTMMVIKWESGGVSEVAPENAREAVLKGLAESYGEKESPNSHHDLMVSALGMCFVRRLAEKTKPKDAMGQPMPMDAGF